MEAGHKRTGSHRVRERFPDQQLAAWLNLIQRISLPLMSNTNPDLDAYEPS